MIISRSPLRVSFIGGGTDFEDFFKFHEGGVISTSINKYVYVLIKDKFTKGIKLSYSNNENVENTSKIKHKLIKEIFQKYKVENNIELISIADIHAQGTGLGSSSAFSLATINSLRHFLSLKSLSRLSLALEAFNLEKSINNSAMGIQDQFASCYGDFNYISFFKNKIKVKKISLGKDERDYLENNFFLIYSETSRSASNILKKHNKIINTMDKTKFLIKMTDEVKKTYLELKKGNIDYLINSINNSWLLKKQFNSEVSNKKIDDLINHGMSNGAKAAKLLGAGVGGFILFCVEKKNQANFKKSFKKYKILNLKIDNEGTKLIKF